MVMAAAMMMMMITMLLFDDDVDYDVDDADGSHDSVRAARMPVT